MHSAHGGHKSGFIVRMLVVRRAAMPVDVFKAAG